MENDEELSVPLLSQVQSKPAEGIAIPFSVSHMDPSIQFMGTLPFSTSPIFGISPDSLFEHQRGAEVLFLNLTEETVFEKVQSRRGGQAKMRVSNGVVEMVCQASVQILCIKVFVFRKRGAAELVGDKNGRLELPVMMGKMDVGDSSESHQQFFSVDLDSVYDGPQKPVYELAKAEMKIRNLFQLAVQVQYMGGLGYQEFTSVPFLLRSRLRKKPDSDNTAQSPYGKRPRQDSGASSDGNTSAPSPDSAYNEEYKSAEYHHLRVLDHLEAKRATIDHVTFKVMESPSNADIGYHFKLNDPDVCDEYDEGDVVGFFEDKHGKTAIDLLDNDNASDAFMAGVITRSAYIEARQSLEKGSSDVVCVIGVVKVKCIGSVRAGERIYTSLDLERPGTAMAESHLPPGVILTHRGTLLGMALEGSKSKKLEEENLVKCFVCIVMGITDKRQSMEIENMYDHFEMQLTSRLKKERKRGKRMLCVTLCVVAQVLAGLAVLFFELFYPGSALRVYICKIGSIEGHYTTFKFTPDLFTSYIVNGVEFSSWSALQKKLKPVIDDVPAFDVHKFNTTRAHYYLNIDRCSYGGIRRHTVLSIDPSKEVGGGIVFAVDHNCTNVYYYTDVHYSHWQRYISVSAFPGYFRCYPKSEFNT